MNNIIMNKKKIYNKLYNEMSFINSFIIQNYILFSIP